MRVVDPTGLGLSDQQGSLLTHFANLLRDIALPKKMIASADSDRIWSRHVLDGVRGAGLIATSARNTCDLGSGAGVPGLPIAIARPDLTMTLTEPRRERAAFLELAVEELQLSNVRVHAGRAQELAEQTDEMDVCLARAFKGPEQSWQVAEPLLAPEGALLYWAGRDGRVRVRGVRTRAFSAPSLADAGPIVMMTRQ
jgi:16S rRNA (guanine527-N7)-methyltransferase